MLTLFENGVTEFLLNGHIANHHTEENNRPILQMGELVVVVGYFCVGADVAVFCFEK